MDLSATYWEDRYQNKTAGWDVGYATTPIVHFFENNISKDSNILIPGAGNGHEAIHLEQQGFNNVHVLDWARSPLQNIKQQLHQDVKLKLIHNDFFTHQREYDIIVEQTFFCALPPDMRSKYVAKMADLLNPGGFLVGLLFNKIFEKEGPPFGGCTTEYRSLFEHHFDIDIMDECYNSIAERAGNEFFIKMTKK